MGTTLLHDSQSDAKVSVQISSLSDKDHTGQASAGAQMSVFFKTAMLLESLLYSPHLDMLDLCLQTSVPCDRKHTPTSSAFTKHIT